MIAIRIPMKAPIAAGDVSLLEKGIPLISAPIYENGEKNEHLVKLMLRILQGEKKNVYNLVFLV